MKPTPRAIAATAKTLSTRLLMALFQQGCRESKKKEEKKMEGKFTGKVPAFFVPDQ
jgi:hypothetical protein